MSLRASGGTTLYLVLPTGLKKYQNQDIVNASIFIPRIAPNVNIPASAILFSSPAGIHGVEPYVNCRLSRIIAWESTVPLKDSVQSGFPLSPVRYFALLEIGDRPKTTAFPLPNRYSFLAFGYIT